MAARACRRAGLIAAVAMRRAQLAGGKSKWRRLGDLMRALLCRPCKAPLRPSPPTHSRSAMQLSTVVTRQWRQAPSRRRGPKSAPRCQPRQRARLCPQAFFGKLFGGVGGDQQVSRLALVRPEARKQRPRDGAAAGRRAARCSPSPALALARGGAGVPAGGRGGADGAPGASAPGRQACHLNARWRRLQRSTPSTLLRLPTNP